MITSTKQIKSIEDLPYTCREVRELGEQDKHLYAGYFKGLRRTLHISAVHRDLMREAKPHEIPGIYAAFLDAYRKAPAP